MDLPVEGGQTTEEGETGILGRGKTLYVKEGNRLVENRNMEKGRRTSKRDIIKGDCSSQKKKKI